MSKDRLDDGSRWQLPPEFWENFRAAARENRKNPTRAEAKLWAVIKDDRLGVTFRRQHSIGLFIVDFYCPTAGIVLEVDGPIHAKQVDEDANRQEFLELKGLKVLRFTNDEVMRNLRDVLKRIRDALNSQSELD